MRARNLVLGIVASLLVGSSAVARAAGGADSGSAAALNEGPHAYHLTYTLTEMDGSKRVGVQHYTLSITGDQHHAILKLGSKVPTPFLAGSTQFRYIDVGLDIDAELREYANGLELTSSVDQSGIGDPSAAMPSEPVIRNSTLQNTTMLTPGKPVKIGLLDEPLSTRHFEIEVTLERLP